MFSPARHHPAVDSLNGPNETVNHGRVYVCVPAHAVFPLVFQWRIGVGGIAKNLSLLLDILFPFLLFVFDKLFMQFSFSCSVSEASLVPCPEYMGDSKETQASQDLRNNSEVLLFYSLCLVISISEGLGMFLLSVIFTSSESLCLSSHTSLPFSLVLYCFLGSKKMLI